MKRSARLLPILKLAELEAEKGARALSFVQHKVQQEQDKLQQLQDYQHECQDNRMSAGRSGISAQDWSIYNHFSHKVDVAIEQQRQQIEHVQTQADQIRAAWQRADSRYRSLEKMLEKIRADELSQQSRQEQRNHDEYARRNRNPWH